MDFYSGLGYAGDRDWKPILLKPGLVAGAGLAWNKFRDRSGAKIDIFGNKVNYDLLHGGVLFASSLVGEAISQYAFPNVKSGNRALSETGSAVVSAVTVGGSSVLSHLLVKPELVQEVSIPELFAEAAVADALSDYVYGRFVAPLLL